MLDANYINIVIAIISPLISGLFGFIGIIVGIFISERYRKKLFFSEKYYEKKIEIYDRLYKMLTEALYGWEDWLRLTSKQNKKKIPDKKEFKKKYKSFFKIPRFLDRHEMYINETIALHIMFTLVAAKDCLKMTGRKRISNEKQTRKWWKQIKDAMREDIGFFRLDKEFKNLNRESGDLKTMDEYIRKLGKKNK